RSQVRLRPRVYIKRGNPAVNPYTRAVCRDCAAFGARLQSLRVTCQKKYRLIEECDAASLHLWHLESSVTVMETPGTQRERLKRRAEEARRTSAEVRSEEHTSELQSRFDLVCRLLLEKKKKK